MEYKLESNKLIYKKEDYSPAVDWEKSVSEGKYAYKNSETDLETLYFGVRYMEKTIDEDVFLKNNLMADLTVLNTGNVGEEFVKTVGHYHGHISGSNLSCAEVYEAVTDNIEYLLQSEPDQEGKVDVLWVVTQAGDKVLMPPNWGHVSMNVGEQVAVEIDIQKRDNPNVSDYSLFKEKIGGAFYRTKAGLVQNSNYKVRSLRIVKPLEKPDWGLTRNKSLYEAVISEPGKFDYLVHPEKYKFELDVLFADIEL